MMSVKFTSLKSSISMQLITNSKFAEIWSSLTKFLKHPTYVSFEVFAVVEPIILRPIDP